MIALFDLHTPSLSKIEEYFLLFSFIQFEKSHINCDNCELFCLILVIFRILLLAVKIN